MTHLPPRWFLLVLLAINAITLVSMVGARPLSLIPAVFGGSTAALLIFLFARSHAHATHTSPRSNADQETTR